jgi:hypothetical protein
MPPNATAAEITEYTETMNAIADNIAAHTPDPQPADFSPDEESDELRAREEEQYWEDMHGREEFYREDAEDRYLDTYWEDQSEYGMEGCCGDF